MIIKNISPYPRSLKDLNDLHLMPGEQADISYFSKQKRAECVELQDAFRKGELICVGVGQKDREDADAKLRIARARILQQGAQQPLMPVKGEYIPERAEPQSLSRAHHLEEVAEDQSMHRYRDDEEQPEVRMIDPEDMPPAYVTRNEDGIISRQPISEPAPMPKSEPEEPKTYPTITPERAREIMSQRCISIRNDGKKCRRWAVRGYEHCVDHMPRDILEEYKRKKKEDFFD